MEPVTKPCPFCAEPILAAALKCKHCGSMVDGSAQPAGPRDVRIAGVDPFAELHTPIAGKKKGELTVIGYLGIVFGALAVIVGFMMASSGTVDAQRVLTTLMIGAGFCVASFLWARK